MNTTIQGLINALLVLIPAAAVPRSIQCLIHIATDAEQAATYKQRLRNMWIFVIIAECATSTIYMIQSYLT